MSTATLTPLANQAPAVVSVQKQLSGAAWVLRFPASDVTSTLSEPFRTNVDAFLAAIEAAGGKFKIANTFRPRKRSYMMHWSHKIFRNGFNPASVPAMAGVEIEWVHATLAQSIEGARQMVVGMDIAGLSENTPPALHSLHNEGEAIDMRIWWPGDLVISSMDGTTVTINTTPRTGMNSQLKQVGLSYGVKKFVGGAADKPHWSTTGH